MLTKRITIMNKSGLHVRPAGVFAKECSRFKCEILVKFKDKNFNGKSVLNILSSAVKCGDEIELICDGADEADAMQALTVLIEAGIGE